MWPKRSWARGTFALALFSPVILLNNTPQAQTLGAVPPWALVASTALLVALAALALGLRARLRQRDAERALLQEVAHIAGESGDLKPMLADVLERTVRLLGATAGAMCIRCNHESEIAVAHQMPVSEAEELLRLLGKTEPMCAGETIQVVRIGPSAPPGLKEKGIAATISIPLIHQGQQLGTMCIALPKDRPIPASRLDALASVGRQVALAIARARLAEESEQNLARLMALRDVDMAISTTLELRPTLRILLEHIRRLEGVVGAAVTLVDGSTRLQTLAEQSGLDALLESAGGWAALDYLGEQVLQAQSAISLSGLTMRRDTPALKPMAQAGIQTYWGFPLIAGNKVIGVLSVLAHTARGFDRALHTFLTALSGQAAAAIQNAHLYNKVTEQLNQLQAARELLVHNEKLSLIGELVSGVAHELNNPLTTVLGYAQMLEEEAEAPQWKNDLHQITDAALRARTIVQGLLSVVRKHEPRREWVDVNRPVQEVLQLKAYQLHVDNIAVETELDPDLPKTLADAHQLHQVFLNLVNNAHQAMARSHGRGTLTVRTYLSDDRTIRVEIADDGPGIPPGLQHRIFEPFFTTKPDGTGLGLSIAEGIVRQHGGSISFESQQGHGCRFFVDLPVATMPEALAAGEEEGELPHVAPARILVVEDEPAVADFIAKALQRGGHSVRCAADGQSALAALADEKPDLIISDIKMPAMRGDQFFMELQVLYPDLVSRVLFVTGDVADPRTVAFLEETGQPRLVKPFGADELRRMVARMLR